jgi:hypothetical protein
VYRSFAKLVARPTIASSHAAFDGEDINAAPSEITRLQMKTPPDHETQKLLVKGGRNVAAAPTKNIENNPMQSSRRRLQPTVWTENLTRRANQRHNFIIPEFAKTSACAQY